MAACLHAASLTRLSVVGVVAVDLFAGMGAVDATRDTLLGRVILPAVLACLLVVGASPALDALIPIVVFGAALLGSISIGAVAVVTGSALATT